MRKVKSCMIHQKRASVKITTVRIVDSEVAGGNSFEPSPSSVRMSSGRLLPRFLSLHSDPSPAEEGTHVRRSTISVSLHILSFRLDSRVHEGCLCLIFLSELFEFSISLLLSCWFEARQVCRMRLCDALKIYFSYFLIVSAQLFFSLPLSSSFSTSLSPSSHFLSFLASLAPLKYPP